MGWAVVGGVAGFARACVMLEARILCVGTQRRGCWGRGCKLSLCASGFTMERSEGCSGYFSGDAVLNVVWGDGGSAGVHAEGSFGELCERGRNLFGREASRKRVVGQDCEALERRDGRRGAQPGECLAGVLTGCARVCEGVRGCERVGRGGLV